MMYNSYLQKCCDTLGEAQDYDSDKFLVALVRIQQLLNRAADIIPYSDDESSSRIPYPPHHMALTAVQRELEALIREQPPDVECNGMYPALQAQPPPMHRSRDTLIHALQPSSGHTTTARYAASSSR